MIGGLKQPNSRYSSFDGPLYSGFHELTANPKIDAVFAINDPTAIGADLAVKQAKRADIKLIASVDGAPDAEVALKDPKNLVGVTTAQNPYKMASEGSDWRDNPVTQIKWTLNYMDERYGSPCSAQSFWESHNWY